MMMMMMVMMVMLESAFVYCTFPQSDVFALAGETRHLLGCSDARALAGVGDDDDDDDDNNSITTTPLMIMALCACVTLQLQQAPLRTTAKQ